MSGVSSELAYDDDEEFDLAKTYIENPAKYYAQQQQRDMAAAGQGRHDAQGRGQVQAQVHAEARGAKQPYRYENGRPLNSSRSESESDQSFDTSQHSVSMTAGGSGNNPVIPEAIKDKAQLIYNPKDGQWYYYYKGKPISRYDPTKVVKNPSGKPEYKYINGRPVLLPVPTKPLNPPV